MSYDDIILCPHHLTWQPQRLNVDDFIYEVIQFKHITQQLNIPFLGC